MSKAKQNDSLRRTALFHEQDELCFYCTRPMLATQPNLRPRPPREVTLDHLTPLAEGGRRGFHNEVAACNECNNRRGTTPWLLFFCLMELERDQPRVRTPDDLQMPAGVSPMNKIDIRREVHRVIGGQDGSHPMGFPHDPRAADAVINITRTFIQYAGGTTQDQRARFIRKFTAYITRTGWMNTNSNAHLFGVMWFATHPQHLSTRLGFGSAIQAQAEAFLQEQNRTRLLTENEILHDLDVTPVVPKPVLLTVADFVLEQLVHAAHVLEAGLAHNNCLKVKEGDRFLPAADYWTRIKRGERHLFSIRHRARMCFLVEITKSRRITQAQFHQPSPPELYSTLPAFATRLESLLGPIDPNGHHYWWPSPKNAAIYADPNQLRLLLGDPA